jgi:hypothetical protein
LRVVSLKLPSPARIGLIDSPGELQAENSEEAKAMDESVFPKGRISRKRNCSIRRSLFDAALPSGHCILRRVTPHSTRTAERQHCSRWPFRSRMDEPPLGAWQMLDIRVSSLRQQRHAAEQTIGCRRSSNPYIDGWRSARIEGNAWRGTTHTLFLRSQLAYCCTQSNGGPWLSAQPHNINR